MELYVLVVGAIVLLFGLDIAWGQLQFLILESTKQRIFEIRDQMFRDAYSGVIDRNDPAYDITRQRLNGLARLAHRMNVKDTISIAQHLKNRPEFVSVQLKRDDACIASSKHSKYYEGRLELASECVYDMLLRSTPILALLWSILSLLRVVMKPEDIRDAEKKIVPDREEKVMRYREIAYASEQSLMAFT